MADQDDALEARRLDDGFDVAGEGVERPLLAVLARLAVAGLIDGDDAIVRREHIHLALPIMAIAAPAVQEDEGGIALAADVVDDAQAVGGTSGRLRRLA